MTPAWAGTTVVLTLTDCRTRDHPSARQALRFYKVAEQGPDLDFMWVSNHRLPNELMCATMVIVELSPQDVDLLASIAQQLDSGRDLVTASELVSCSGRSADDVDRALAMMRAHRPELFRSVLDPGGRVVAVTVLTPAGRRIVRSQEEACSPPRKGRRAALRRLFLQVGGVAVVAAVRVFSEHLRFD